MGNGTTRTVHPGPTLPPQGLQDMEVRASDPFIKDCFLLFTFPFPLRSTLFQSSHASVILLFLYHTGVSRRLGGAVSLFGFLFLFSFMGQPSVDLFQNKKFSALPPANTMSSHLDDVYSQLEPIKPHPSAVISKDVVAKDSKSSAVQPYSMGRVLYSMAVSFPLIN